MQIYKSFLQKLQLLSFWKKNKEISINFLLKQRCKGHRCQSIHAALKFKVCRLFFFKLNVPVYSIKIVLYWYILSSVYVIMFDFLINYSRTTMKFLKTTSIKYFKSNRTRLYYWLIDWLNPRDRNWGKVDE